MADQPILKYGGLLLLVLLNALVLAVCWKHSQREPAAVAMREAKPRAAASRPAAAPSPYGTPGAPATRPSAPALSMDPSEVEWRRTHPMPGHEPPEAPGQVEGMAHRFSARSDESGSAPVRTLPSFGDRMPVDVVPDRQTEYAPRPEVALPLQQNAAPSPQQVVVEFQANESRLAYDATRADIERQKDRDLAQQLAWEQRQPPATGMRGAFWGSGSVSRPAAPPPPRVHHSAFDNWHPQTPRVAGAPNAFPANYRVDLGVNRSTGVYQPRVRSFSGMRGF